MTHIGHSEKVLFMRLFILVLILIFSLQSWNKADDIRDYEIEGISIGDSLLDHFSEDEIINGIMHDHVYSVSYTHLTLPTKA